MKNTTYQLCMAIAEATIDQAIAEHESNQLARAIAKCGPTPAQPVTFHDHLTAAMEAETRKKAS
jgi:predicted GIY-YIG superfamily endonuclease